MSDELEPEILSYREFKRREALLAWDQRRRAFEARVRRLGIDRKLGAPPTVLRARERHGSETDGPHR
jgi:hypothetical protein